MTEREREWIKAESLSLNLPELSEVGIIYQESASKTHTLIHTLWKLLCILMTTKYMSNYCINRLYYKQRCFREEIQRLSMYYLVLCACKSSLFLSVVPKNFFPFYGPLFPCAFIFPDLSATWLDISPLLAFTGSSLHPHRVSHFYDKIAFSLLSPSVRRDGKR